METVTVDRYRRSDGTKVIRHKRRLPHNLRVNKSFFNNENNSEDNNDKKIVYPKKSDKKDDVVVIGGGCGGDFTNKKLEEMSECSPEEIAQMKRDTTKYNRDLRLKKRIEKVKSKGKKRKNTTLKGQAKVEVVMKEFKKGKLRSSSGEKVTKRSQAVAIAMSEAGLSKPKQILTKRKAKSFSKEEALASKEYGSLGFKKIANDEHRHHEFFEKKTKELGKR